MEVSSTDPVLHYRTSILGEPACCKLRSDGVIYYLQCIEDSSSRITGRSDRDRGTAKAIIELVDRRGDGGSKIEDLIIGL